MHWGSRATDVSCSIGNDTARARSRPETGYAAGAIVSLFAEDVWSRAMIEGDGGPPAQGTVRGATSGDVPGVAALHCLAIDEGFLSTLGDRFLARLYSRIVASPHGFLLVADSDQVTEGGGPRVAGFVAGSAAVGRLYREFLWRDGLSALMSSAPRLMRSLPRAIETLRYGATDTPARDEGEAGSRTAATEAELLALAVDGAERQRGVGKALVEAFMTTARTAGSTSARVVVGSTNHRAIALYGRAGFSESERLELHSGTESLVMRVGLHPTPP